MDLIEDGVPGLKGRLYSNHIAAVGHSFGTQTTAAALLGTRVIDVDGKLSEDFTDLRIKAGALLSVSGVGGEALSPFAKEHFPHLNQSYAGMKIQTLVGTGDQDRSLLTVEGSKWFTDAFYQSPGANNLLVLFAGEHTLGGISGYLVKETTDENQERVRAIQQLTSAYLVSALHPNNPAWQIARSLFFDIEGKVGKVIIKAMIY